MRLSIDRAFAVNHQWFCFCLLFHWCDEVPCLLNGCCFPSRSKLRLHHLLWAHIYKKWNNQYSCCLKFSQIFTDQNVNFCYKMTFALLKHQTKVIKIFFKNLLCQETFIAVCWNVKQRVAHTNKKSLSKENLKIHKLK